MVHQEEIHFSTQATHEIHDLTARVLEIVRKSGATTGVVNVFNLGSTGAVGAMELERGLARDLPTLLERLVPSHGEYAHEATQQDGNGHSHLQATLMGPSLTVPVMGGKPALGTWQQIFFVECDVKPRRRTIIVTVYGE
jgi:secondary thiamine-phosphate synthase enzyme